MTSKAPGTTIATDPDPGNPIGSLIDDISRRQDWRDLVQAVHAARAAGGPLERWVFHGTDGVAARSVEDWGLRSSRALASTSYAEWEETEGVHFGTPRVAAFFAEDRIESLEDPGIELVLFAAPLDSLAVFGEFAADGQMVDVPLCSRLCRTEAQVDQDWSGSAQDWQACLRVLGTVIVLGDVPAAVLTPMRSKADLALLLETLSRPVPRMSRS